jgi:hypothetical protein
MPDFQEFAVIRNGTISLTVPQWTVSLKVTDSKTGAVLFDRTGVNSFSFPQILGQLTVAQQDEFVQMAIGWLLRKRLGLE